MDLRMLTLVITLVVGWTVSVPILPGNMAEYEYYYYYPNSTDSTGTGSLADNNTTVDGATIDGASKDNPDRDSGVKADTPGRTDTGVYDGEGLGGGDGANSPEVKPDDVITQSGSGSIGEDAVVGVTQSPRDGATQQEAPKLVSGQNQPKLKKIKKVKKQKPKTAGGEHVQFQQGAPHNQNFPQYGQMNQGDFQGRHQGQGNFMPHQGQQFPQQQQQGQFISPQGQGQFLPHHVQMQGQGEFAGPQGQQMPIQGQGEFLREHGQHGMGKNTGDVNVPPHYTNLPTIDQHPMYYDAPQYESFEDGVFYEAPPVGEWRSPTEVYKQLKKKRPNKEVVVEELYVPAYCHTYSRLGDVLKILFNTTLSDGTLVDHRYGTDSPLELRSGYHLVQAGLEQGVMMMCPGQVRAIIVPPLLAFGESEGLDGKVPANSTLVFIVELVEIVPPKAGFKNVFKRIDLNSDLVLTWPEVHDYFLFVKQQQGLHNMPGGIDPDQHRRLVDEVFIKEDLNRDGTISFHEFRGPKWHDEL